MLGMRFVFQPVFVDLISENNGEILCFLGKACSTNRHFMHGKELDTNNSPGRFDKHISFTSLEIAKKNFVQCSCSRFTSARK